MGEPMAMRLLSQGYSLTVHTRTVEKATRLLKNGAIWADSPAQAVRKASVIFSMLGYPEDLEKVMLGPHGVIAGINSGTVVVDMTTSSPELAMRMTSEFKSKNSSCLDAPVSGGDVGAKNGTLAIMCGGQKVAYQQVLPVLECLGTTIDWFGPAGSGQRAKLANQILIASSMVGTVESLLYAERANLDLMQVIRILGKGAAGCWSLNQLGPRMIREDWEPGFYVKHFLKDMAIVLEDAKRFDLKLQGVELVQRFYNSAKKKGFENEGTQVLLKVLREMNASTR